MPDTGAPWNIPYAAPTDLVRDWPALSEDIAEAVADGLDIAASYTNVAVITATDASWPVPTLANSYVRVTVIGGGGSGGGSLGTNGSAGGTTTFNAGSGKTFSASGGTGGQFGWQTQSGVAGTAGFAASNGGQGATFKDLDDAYTGCNGNGGQIVVAYVDLGGISTVNVTVGAGGTGGGGAGGRGEVIVEYVAG
jgi:hypothetical protein